MPCSTSLGCKGTSIQYKEVLQETLKALNMGKGKILIPKDFTENPEKILLGKIILFMLLYESSKLIESIVGAGIWRDCFEILRTKWLHVGQISSSQKLLHLQNQVISPREKASPGVSRYSHTHNSDFFLQYCCKKTKWTYYWKTALLIAQSFIRFQENCTFKLAIILTNSKLPKKRNQRNIKS